MGESGSNMINVAGLIWDTCGGKVGIDTAGGREGLETDEGRGGGGGVHVIFFRKPQKSETKTCLKNLKEIDSEVKIEPQYTKPYTTVLVYHLFSV